MWVILHCRIQWQTAVTACFNMQTVTAIYPQIAVSARLKNRPLLPLAASVRQRVAAQYLQWQAESVKMERSKLDIWITAVDCTANDSNCSLFRWAVTAVCLCGAVQTAGDSGSVMQCRLGLRAAADPLLSRRQSISSMPSIPASSLTLSSWGMVAGIRS